MHWQETAGENRRQLHKWRKLLSNKQICENLPQDDPRWNLLWQTFRWFEEHLSNFPSSPEMLNSCESCFSLQLWRKMESWKVGERKKDSHNLMFWSKSNGRPHFWVQSFNCSWNSSTDVHTDEHFQLERHLHLAERPRLKNYKVAAF